jgi:ribosome-binding protein aMBF1 (putative translation factor)
MLSGLHVYTVAQIVSEQHPDIKSRVAGNIAAAIEDSGLSIMEIARRMGGTTSDKTIRRWRDGETSPDQLLFARFATIVGVDDLTWFYLPHENEQIGAAA